LVTKREKKSLLRKLPKETKGVFYNMPLPRARSLQVTTTGESLTKSENTRNKFAAIKSATKRVVFSTKERG